MLRLVEYEDSSFSETPQKKITVDDRNQIITTSSEDSRRPDDELSKISDLREYDGEKDSIVEEQRTTMLSADIGDDGQRAMMRKLKRTECGADYTASDISDDEASPERKRRKDSMELSISESSISEYTDSNWTDDSDFTDDEASCSSPEGDNRSPSKVDFKKSKARIQFNFEQLIEKYEKVKPSGIEIDARTGQVFAPDEVAEGEVEQLLHNLDKIVTTGAGLAIFSAAENRAALHRRRSLAEKCDNADERFEEKYASVPDNKIPNAGKYEDGEEEEDVKTSICSISRDETSSIIESEQSSALTTISSVSTTCIAIPRKKYYQIKDPLDAFADLNVTEDSDDEALTVLQLMADGDEEFKNNMSLGRIEREVSESLTLQEAEVWGANQTFYEDYDEELKKSLKIGAAIRNIQPVEELPLMWRRRVQKGVRSNLHPVLMPYVKTGLYQWTIFDPIRNNDSFCIQNVTGIQRQEVLDVFGRFMVFLMRLIRSVNEPTWAEIQWGLECLRELVKSDLDMTARSPRLSSTLEFAEQLRKAIHRLRYNNLNKCCELTDKLVEDIEKKRDIFRTKERKPPRQRV